MPEINLRSRDGRFGLWLDAHHVERILGYCAAAKDLETGGVLVGRYSARHDMAFVTDVPAPPRDSAAGRTWLQRGTKGLQQILSRAWSIRKEHYIGEWHFHPFAAPTPSPDDHAQMQLIAAGPSWACPEPVQLIIGGDPAGAWRSSGLVVTRTGDLIELSVVPANADSRTVRDSEHARHQPTKREH